MAKRNGETFGRTILGIAAVVLSSQAASPVRAMDTDGPRLSSYAAESPYKAGLTPFVAHDGSSGGFGLFASSGHHTVNLAQPTTWSVNPDASPSGTAVGLGWRARNLSATMGYVRPPSGAGPEAFSNGDGPSRFKSRSTVGFGFALRY